ncbi:FAD-dependent oxidoreductase [Pseudomonas sp. LRF_L74]|uniref:FAD-dependent oxidoreductase n=1 Tax=Pseudomonas sp. LRF_L74 TaxID=3369422 RepID=UPI003F610197
MKDLAIVGAGTAGLATAIYLARQGYRVRVLDQVPALGPIGAGVLLQPAGMAVLLELGILDECTRLGAPISRLYGTSACAERVILDTRYDHWRPGSFGLGMHRSALMSALYKAAVAAGVVIETGVRVSRYQQADSHVQLFAEGPEGERALGDFAALVLANGTRSALREQMRVRQSARPYPWGALWSMLPTPVGQTDELRQWYRHCAQMFGLMPTGRASLDSSGLTSLFWSLPVADYPAWREAGLDAWKQQIRQLAGDPAEAFLEQIGEPGQLTLAAYADVYMARWNDGRVLAIGDCAHAMSPQLGQGANMALIDAAALSAALGQVGERGQETDWPTVFTAYGKLRSSHIRYYRQASRWLTPLFQSHSRSLSVLRDTLLFLARHMPASRAHAVTTLVGGRTGWLFSRHASRPLHEWNGQAPAVLADETAPAQAVSVATL